MPSQKFDRRSLRRLSGMMFAVLVALMTAFQLDIRVAAWAGYCQGPLLDALVGVINPIGSGLTLLIVCVALIVCARWFRWSRLEGAASIGALAFACAGLSEFALKHLVSRSRPDAVGHAPGLLGPAFVPDFDSFPSGHATSVFAVAASFAASYPALGPVLYLVAAAVSVGRVYLARHYLSDIVAGATIGIVVVSLLLRHSSVRSRWTSPHPATVSSR